MIEWWQIYLITRADVVQSVFKGLSLLCGAGAFSALIAAMLGEVEGMKPWPPRLAICCVVSLLLLSATPSTKDLILIYGIPKLLSGQEEALEHINGLPLKTVKVLEQYLDEKRGTEKGGQE